MSEPQGFDDARSYPRLYEASWDATKAKLGGLVAAGLGFVAPGATYLLTVDGDGITTTELVHALLIAIVGAAAGGGAVAGTVYAAKNKLKTTEVEQ